MLVFAFILSFISMSAIPESVGLLAFGAGLFGIAVTLRRFIQTDKAKGDK